ncbi:MAG TPA: ABC transporter permease [Actinomycetota bacterium]|nr:ABC transporter permease [Actinomycetota bacterium]
MIADIAQWFTDAAHWRGTGGVPHRMLEHAELSALAIGCAALVAIPLGALLGHSRRGGFLAVGVVNIGRAIPSFAIVAVALPISLRLGLGYGFWPTWLAVFLLALPPMFTNAFTAVRGVDDAVVDAARGMGMSGGEVLRGVELPLAAPVILAATRVAAVQVVATAPLGAVIGWGGLGRFIIDGLAQFDIPQVFAGALLVALLAIATDAAFGLAQRVVLPSGVQRLTRVEATETFVGTGV